MPEKVIPDPQKRTHPNQRGGSLPVHNGLLPASTQWTPTEDDFTLPKSDWTPSKETFTPPKSQWKPSSDDYKVPKSSWKRSGHEMTPPKSSWKPTITDMTPPKPEWKSSTTEVKPPPVVVEPPKREEGPMGRLVEMGFTDRKTNTDLLEAFDNDLSQVIPELLALGFKDASV